MRKAFPGPFVNYLSRFLLSYDEGSRAFWRAGSAEIPIAWDEQKVRRKRATQFANYAASVAVWKSNFQPDFNVSVCDGFDTSSSAVLRELDESNRFVQKSAESTSM